MLQSFPSSQKCLIIIPLGMPAVESLFRDGLAIDLVVNIIMYRRPRWRHSISCILCIFIKSINCSEALGLFLGRRNFKRYSRQSMYRRINHIKLFFYFIYLKLVFFAVFSVKNSIDEADVILVLDFLQRRLFLGNEALVIGLQLFDGRFKKGFGRLALVRLLFHSSL